MEDKPITLSQQEVQNLLTELASRDPVMRFLMQKQAAAQAAADEQPTPMRVVGGAA